MSLNPTTAHLRVKGYKRCRINHKSVGYKPRHDDLHLQNDEELQPVIVSRGLGEGIRRRHNVVSTAVKQVVSGGRDQPVPRIFRGLFGIVSSAAHSLQGRRTRPYHILPEQAYRMRPSSSSATASAPGSAMPCKFAADK